MLTVFNRCFRFAHFMHLDNVIFPIVYLSIAFLHSLKLKTVHDGKEKKRSKRLFKQQTNKSAHAHAHSTSVALSCRVHLRSRPFSLVHKAHGQSISYTMRNNCIHNRSIIRAFSLINLFFRWTRMKEMHSKAMHSQCRKSIATDDKHANRDRKNIRENTNFSTSSVFNTITSDAHRVPMRKTFFDNYISLYVIEI